MVVISHEDSEPSHGRTSDEMKYAVKSDIDCGAVAQMAGLAPSHRNVVRLRCFCLKKRIRSLWSGCHAERIVPSSQIGKIVPIDALETFTPSSCASSIADEGSRTPT